MGGSVKHVIAKPVKTNALPVMTFVMEMANVNVTNVNVILLTLVSLHNQTSVKLSNLVVSNMHHVPNVHTMDS